MFVHMGEYLTLHASAGELSGLVATFCVLLALTGLALVSVWLIYVDLRDHRLPGVVVRPAWAGAAGLLGLAAVLSDQPQRLLGMGLGAIGMWGVYYLLRKASAGALGLGDVRLAAMLGTVLGFASVWTVLWGTILGFLVGGLVAVLLLLTRRAHLTDRVPFGPSMLVGAMLALVLV